MTKKDPNRAPRPAPRSSLAKPKRSRPAARKRPGAGAKTASSAATSLAPAPAPAKGDAGSEPKLVRDSYTIPKSEYADLEQLKVRAANLRRPTKKSELLRAGVAVLRAMNDKSFLAVLAEVPSLKTGRPKKRSGGK